MLDANRLSKPSEAVRDKHILIVGINYWPEPTGIAPYTTEIAEHLSRSAASVTVVCGPPSYPSWQVPSAHRRWRARSHRHGVDVVRLRHYVPRKQTTMRRGMYEATFAARVTICKGLPSPDIVFTVTPSLGGAVAASHLARRHAVPLVVHVQDLLGKAASQSGMSASSTVASCVQHLERRLLTRASLVLSVSPGFAPALEQYGVAVDRRRTLRNWTHVSPSGSERWQVRQRLGWGEHVTIALHTGNMGLKQDLANIVEAARSSRRDTKLRWVLMGDGSQRESLERHAAGLPNLSIVAPCAAEDYSDVLSAADILLVNELPTLDDMSLPSKLTSYFVAGRPLVAAVPPEGATAQEVKRSGAGDVVPAGSPEKLWKAVEALQVSPTRAGDLGAAGRRYAAHQTTRWHAFDQLNEHLRSVFPAKREGALRPGSAESRTPDIETG